MKVVIARRARADLKEASVWWSEQRSAEQAVRWYAKALEIVRSLSKHAERHPYAEENGYFPFEVRQVTFGLGAKPTHRALFTIRTDMVLVLRVRHLAQDAVRPED